MLKSCEKCSKNNWALSVVDGAVHATCDSCGNEIKFASSAKRKLGKDLKEGDQCGVLDRTCLGRLVWKFAEIDANRLKKAYHYEKWLKCDTCGATFLDNRYKVKHKVGVDGKIRFQAAIQKVEA